MGGAPIGAGGHDPTFRRKGDMVTLFGDNSSRILLLSRHYINVNAVSSLFGFGCVPFSELRE